MKQIQIDNRRTGSGKTTNAVMYERQRLEKELGKKFKNAFLLTPYTRAKEQILENDRFSGYVIPLSEYGSTFYPQEQIDRSVYVSTYAAMSNYLANNAVDLTDSLIIFDELPTFFEFTAYQSQLGYLLEYLADSKLSESVYIEGLTGTPQMLTRYFNGCSGTGLEFVNLYDSPSQILKAKKGTFITGSTATTYARKLIADGLASALFFYVDSAKEAVSLYYLFNEAGYKAGFIVSESNEDIDVKSGLDFATLMRRDTYNGLSVPEWIDTKQDIPAELDVLIVNAAARDAINIVDSSSRIQEVVIESVDKMAIEQARARVRHDIEALTVIYNRKYMKTRLKSLKDCLLFFEELAAGSRQQELLADRYNEQKERDIAINNWRSRKNSEENFNVPCPESLDYIVHKGSQGYFVNPFIKPLMQYSVDNFYFSEISREFEDGEEIITRTNVISAGRLLPTLEEFVNSLSHLLDNNYFKIESGKGFISHVRNLESFDIDYFIRALGLVQNVPVKVTSKTLQEVAANSGLVDSARRPIGKTTLIKWLKNAGCIVENKRSKSERYYLITLC